MTDPEVDNGLRMKIVSRSNGGKKKIIGGSVYEAGAIMRNYSLELVLNDTRKRIDRDRRVRVRGIQEHQRVLKKILGTKQVALHGSRLGIQRPEPVRPAVKLLWRERVAGYRHVPKPTQKTEKLGAAPSYSLKHIDKVGKADQGGVRPRAISLESYFPRAGLQRPQPREERVDDVDNVALRGLRNHGCFLPDIHENRSCSPDRREFVDGDVEKANVDAIPRESPTEESFPSIPSPEPMISALQPRRASRLRSVTISEVQDIEATRRRRDTEEQKEKLRRRSDGRQPNLEDIHRAGMHQKLYTDVSETRRRSSSLNCLSDQNELEVKLDEAEKLLKKCHLDPTREHVDFQREVSRISSSFND